MRWLKISILVVSFSLFLCGCDSSDYKRATDLFENGEYGEAQIIFESLGDYEDSAEMAKESKYQNGLLLFEQEEYGLAKETFESLGEYKDSADILQKIGWKIFADYLIREEEIVIKDTSSDFKSTVTLSMDGDDIVVMHSFDAAILNYTFGVVLEPENPTTTFLAATGHANIFSAYSDDYGIAYWDITTYKKGDDLKEWSEYVCTGIDANGRPLATGATGTCYNTTASGLENLTDGIKTALEKSNTGVSMSDLGFWAY